MSHSPQNYAGLVEENKKLRTDLAQQKQRNITLQQENADLKKKLEPTDQEASGSDTRS